MVFALALFAILAVFCLFYIIFLQQPRIKLLATKNVGLNTNLMSVEKMYNELLIANTRLEERCSLSESISEKYDKLLEKHSDLEKQSVSLLTNLEQERKNHHEKVELLEAARQKLSDTFKAISQDALSKNNEIFTKLAESKFGQFQEKAKSEFAMSTKSMNDLVSPIKTALENLKLDQSNLEKSRVGAYESLKQQVGDLITTQNSLKNETGNLASALRTPNVRGCWGEMQLRRVVELAGMVEHCHFKEQVEVKNMEGGKLCPDMVIYMPGGQEIIVDAKTTLSAYLEANDCTNEGLRKKLFEKHASQIRDRIKELSKKEYWSYFEKSPEFVVMFIPSEVFFSAAAESDPALLEHGMRNKVIIATPSTLLALLYTTAFGWRQEKLAENVEQIRKMGQDLYERLAIMTDHIKDIGKNINSAAQSYNSMVGSFESRVLVSARRFKELGAAHEKEIIELSSVETGIRQLKDQ